MKSCHFHFYESLPELDRADQMWVCVCVCDRVRFSAFSSWIHFHWGTVYISAWDRALLLWCKIMNEPVCICFPKLFWFQWNNMACVCCVAVIQTLLVFFVYFRFAPPPEAAGLILEKVKKIQITEYTIWNELNGFTSEPLCFHRFWETVVVSPFKKVSVLSCIFISAVCVLNILSLSGLISSHTGDSLLRWRST